MLTILYLDRVYQVCQYQGGGDQEDQAGGEEEQGGAHTTGELITINVYQSQIEYSSFVNHSDRVQL
jgi:hypothetical protein